MYFIRNTCNFCCIRPMKKRHLALKRVGYILLFIQERERERERERSNLTNAQPQIGFEVVDEVIEAEGAAFVRRQTHFRHAINVGKVDQVQSQEWLLP